MALEYLSLKEAREYLGISKPKMRRLIKEAVISVYSDQRDKRKRLVRREDIERLRQPQLLSG